MSKRIPYCIISDAKNGSGEAMTSILRHYDSYINYYSLRESIGIDGKQRLDVNEDIRQFIITKLIIAIIRNFDHTEYPDEGYRKG